MTKKIYYFNYLSYYGSLFSAEKFYCAKSNSIVYMWDLC